MIPIGITARNEAKNIRILLSTLRESVRRAEAALHLRFELHVILNDNEDHTPTLLADEKELTVWQTRGGLVEAQRALVHARPAAPWILFTDADILIHPDTITELAAAMQQHPDIEIAYAEKYPLPPLRRTLLAQALYCFNLREGYQTKRLYCNGQCFAIRRWHIPTVAELRWDPAADNPFLNLAAGIRGDDIYLSLGRAPEALRCTPAGIQYRPPGCAGCSASTSACAWNSNASPTSSPAKIPGVDASTTAASAKPRGGNKCSIAFSKPPCCSAKSPIEPSSSTTAASRKSPAPLGFRSPRRRSRSGDRLSTSWPRRA